MGARQGPPGSLAARVTYLLEPKNWRSWRLSRWWKISIHCAADALRDHTTAQVIRAVASSPVRPSMRATAMGFM
jgi:hypothetical protein